MFKSFVWNLEIMRHLLLEIHIVGPVNNMFLYPYVLNSYEWVTMHKIWWNSSKEMIAILNHIRMRWILYVLKNFLYYET